VSNHTEARFISGIRPKDDLDRQRRFYRDVLGFIEIAESPDWVQFDLCDSRLLKIVQRSGQPPYDPSQARYQVGYAVEDIEDVPRELMRWPCSLLAVVLLPGRRG
jgi:extradiol dioxygenase family protein